MFCKIELIPKKQIDDEIEELLWSFLVCLKRNGQIINDYRIVKSENYLLYVTFPKEDSFDEKYDGVYVKRDREKIKETFDYVVTVIGRNVSSQPYCDCEKRKAIEMETFKGDIDSVFTCCDCGKPIVLYEIPFLEMQDDHYHILDWQENYSAIDELWMNCLSDRYTGNQMVNINSALNKQGTQIAEYISSQLGYKVYYHLSDEYGRKIKYHGTGRGKIHICPKCDRVMTRIEMGEDREIDVCDECNLSYNGY
jgi:predicted  nucleic acid-binding Zn ribbon protein